MQLPELGNPSRPKKRALVVFFALVGALIPARLTAFQIGWTDAPWEPFFGAGTKTVLRSAFSRGLPFPDAGLGLLAYLTEAATAAWGSSSRFRDQRLPIYAYAASAAALALVSAGLVFMQVFVLNAYCSLCLASAMLSFALLAPAATEFLAAWRARQHLR